MGKRQWMTLWIGLCLVGMASWAWAEKTNDKPTKAPARRAADAGKAKAGQQEKPVREKPKAGQQEPPVREKPQTQHYRKLLPAGARTKAIPSDTVRSGEALYQDLVKAAEATQGPEASLFADIRKTAAGLSWKGTEEKEAVGNLRLLRQKNGKTREEVVLLRETDGTLHILALPQDPAATKKGSKSPYANLKKMMRHKMTFSFQTTRATVHDQTLSFAKLTAAPQRSVLDRLFFVAIVALLFFVMVGMGLTLTMGDFALVMKEPRGMLVGPLCQFVLLPFLAFLLGKATGLAGAYPYIFAGMILVTSSPGGVTSNLMTYLGKGDVALSVSLTALSTVLSIVLTPMLLMLYVRGIPQLSIPVVDIIKTILVLVIVPLIVGMLIRNRAPQLAKRSEKFFSGLGIFALLFLIVVGVSSNLDKFVDTTRYGVRFYGTIFVLTLAGMVLGGVLARLLGVRNAQARAIALETGMQNSSLAMTLALLLQDRMGDFYSSMFFTSGIFGLWMYFAGAIVINLFPKILPLEEEQVEAAPAQEA